MLFHFPCIYSLGFSEYEVIKDKDGTLTRVCLQIMQESKLSVVIEKVFDRCLAPSPGGVGCDNMTMILVQFKKSSYFKACGEKQQPLPSDQQSEAVCSPSKS